MLAEDITDFWLALSPGSTLPSKAANASTIKVTRESFVSAIRHENMRNLKYHLFDLSNLSRNDSRTTPSLLQREIRSFHAKVVAFATGPRH